MAVTEQLFGDGSTDAAAGAGHEPGADSHLHSLPLGPVNA
jgi:hypothetical protein